MKTIRQGEQIIITLENKTEAEIMAACLNYVETRMWESLDQVYHQKNGHHAGREISISKGKK